MMKTAVLVSVFSCTIPAVAQTQILLQINGTNSERLGYAGIALLGDVNGDGIPDFAAAPSFVTPTYVRAYSGSTGAAIWTVASLWTDGALMMTGGGDVDGDGIADLLARHGNTGGLSPLGFSYGAVRVLSGATGTTIRLHSGTGIGIEMPPPGGIIGDADADGFDDYLLANAMPLTWVGYGQPYLVSGRTGSILYRIPGRCSGMRDWATGLGDVDADGFDDYAICEAPCGSPWGCWAGSVAGYSGNTGSLLFRVSGTYGQDLHFRGPRCGGADLNGDGINDLLIASNVTNVGRIQALSGSDGVQLWERWGAYAGENLGMMLGIGDDWNGDGHADVVARAGNPSRLLVLSGVDGGTLASTPMFGLTYGLFPLLAEDWNGDGSREVLSTGGDVMMHGGVWMTSHGTGPLSYRREIGRGCLASNGFRPRALARQDPRLGSVFQTRLRGTTPNSLPVLAIGLPFPTGVFFEWTAGCRLHVDPLLGLFAPATNTHGMSALDIPIPAIPALAGLRLAMQWLVLDLPANPSGFIGSTALELILGA